MKRAMLYKELREIAWIALLGLAVQGYFLAQLMDMNLLFMSPRQQDWIPFVSGDFLPAFIVVAIATTALLGLWQSVGESTRGTWLFLLHRPSRRSSLLGAKVLLGVVLSLASGALPVLLYGWWAAIPGTHASPFEWSMTVDCWQAVATFPGVYLAAFLAGLRPARWFGTRLAPLVAAA